MSRRTKKSHSASKVIAYLRVSTGGQGDSGLGLEAQEAKCRAYAELYDLEIVRFVTEVASAKSVKRRPLLLETLQAIDDGEAGGLLVAKLDRLTRSVRDLGGLLADHFHEDGAALLSVAEQVDTRTAAGRLVLNVLGSVSQWEREEIGERTKAALSAKKARGEATGGDAPFGYRKTKAGRLARKPREQKCIARMLELQAEGLSLRKISDQLHEDGYANRRGEPFQAMTIARTLKAEAKRRAA